MSITSDIVNNRKNAGVRRALQQQGNTSLLGSTQKADTKTSAGLYQLATQSGLQSQADKILKNKGEKTKKIFSGGFISDVFDALNALQYGVVGKLKGKGFAEGVKTRASFSDKDSFGSKGTLGVIQGIALDILVDPLTYISPWKVVSKIKPLAKLAKTAKGAVFGNKVIRSIKTGEKISDLASAAKKGEKVFETVEGGTKAGKYFARKLKYAFGQDPGYLNTWKRSEVGKLKSINNIMDTSNKLVHIPEAKWGDLAMVGKDGRPILKPMSEIKNVLDNKTYRAFEASVKNLDALGEEAVKLKVLSRKTWEANRFQYIKAVPEKYAIPQKGKTAFGYLKKGINQIKARKKLSAEAIEELKYIKNPSYILAKSQLDLLKMNEDAKFFKAVASKFGSDKWVEGMAKVPIPKAASYGDLAGKYVPEFLKDSLTELQRVKSPSERLAGQIIAGFKYGKVILNPATHVRNVASNMVLNWWKLGIGPWRADIYAQALKPSETILKELETVPYNLNTFRANELGNILNGPEASGIIGKIKGLSKKFGDLYQGEENFAKRAAYIYNRNKGLGIEDAWKAAEAATFNYAEVTPFVRRLRESIWGYPFITFGIKAAPIAVETAVKYPRRISAFGKLKTGLENLSDPKELEREKASEPSWMKNGFYVKLPMKDKHGRSAYFDLTYIIPFGDLVSGQFFERGVSRETGLPESVPSAALQKSPLLNLIKELSSNQDFYGDKLWKESDDTSKQLGDIMRHLTRLYAPPMIADQIPGGYMTSGERRVKGIRGTLSKDEQIKQQRTLMQELLRNVGAKIQPIDVDIQETYMEWEKKKALENLLKEAGILKEFSTSYVPKK